MFAICVKHAVNLFGYACTQLPGTGAAHEVSARYAGGNQRREQPHTSLTSVAPEDHVSFIMLSRVSFDTGAAEY